MKKYLITSDDVQIIYDAIRCGEPQKQSLRIKQLELMIKLRERLDETEVSPWAETVHPWEDENA